MQQEPSPPPPLPPSTALERPPSGEEQREDLPQHLSRVNYLAMDAFASSLEDQTTHKAYFQAILDNRYLFEGKDVLHLTEGMNCLASCFAAEAGCRKVYCVVNKVNEKDMFMMRQIVKENKMEDVIEVMAWKDFNHCIEIIIGEPMGYCMHFDGMLDRMIEARDLYLCKKGLIFPNQLSFKCALIHDQHFQDHKVEFWNNVYGVPMKSIKHCISQEPIIRVIDPSLVVSKIARILNFNLHTLTYQEVVRIDRVFQLELLGQCRANGLTFWFESLFEHGIEKKDIKASPWVESTKFTQATLYWPIVEEYKGGGKIRIRVKGQKFPSEGRSHISTEIDYKLYQYHFS